MKSQENLTTVSEYTEPGVNGSVGKKISKLQSKKPH